MKGQSSRRQREQVRSGVCGKEVGTKFSSASSSGLDNIFRRFAPGRESRTLNNTPGKFSSPPSCADSFPSSSRYLTSWLPGDTFAPTSPIMFDFIVVGRCLLDSAMVLTILHYCRRRPSPLSVFVCWLSFEVTFVRPPTISPKDYTSTAPSYIHLSSPSVPPSYLLETSQRQSRRS